MRRYILFAFTLGLVASCSSSREFWQYVVEDNVAKPLMRETGKKDEPRALSPYNVKVVYNDGTTSTEVIIPILSSGQQIIIDHKGITSPTGLSPAPLPPVDADKSVEEGYAASGNPINDRAPAVSLVKTSERIRELVKSGNYALALVHADQILARYPNHVKTLQTKGSLLLRLGEREAAIKAYQRAQELEPDPRVEEQLKKLEQKVEE
jgi:tetratricopeptide (TPR) repeat protein